MIVGSICQDCGTKVPRNTKRCRTCRPIPCCPCGEEIDIAQGAKKFCSLVCAYKWRNKRGKLSEEAKQHVYDLHAARVGKIKCALCTRWFHMLTHHVQDEHGVKAAEYREQHGSLFSPKYLAKASAGHKRWYANGAINPMLGKKHSPERIELQSSNSLKMWANPEFHQKQVAVHKRWWQTASDEKKRQRLAKSRLAQKVRPTKPELLVKSMIDELALPFRYSGDGTAWIGNHNPDFVNKRGKRVIEVFGCYWHGCPTCARPSAKEDDSQERIDYYARFGYTTHIIWEHELRDLANIKQRLFELL